VKQDGPGKIGMKSPEETAKLAQTSGDVRSIGATLATLVSGSGPYNIAFSTSLSLEDQVITHMIATENLPVRIFTLDTGRHFSETYKTLQSTRDRYGINIEVYFPQAAAVEALMTKKGAYSFYESIEARKECCAIRKVEPLARAIKGVDVWITGIRKVHSPDRQNLPAIEVDHTNKLVKYHPLLDWTDFELKQYVDENNIPYNRLQDKGFLSIGCEPCTRAVKPGEDMRAGRWWWENPDKKECGLHIHT
jgi:phosphoadenosine phosphosulfate reductase